MTKDKLQNESDTEYELLQTFLLMGFGRSVTELAELHGVSRQYIYNIMKKNDWKNRIASHDKSILKQIREKHNSTFQADALLRRENLVQAYSLLQHTFSKMLSYSDRYTSTNMEADEFLNKTDKLFKIIQRYEKISQSCEKYLEKFGIETVGQNNHIETDLDSINQDLEDFNDENSDLIESEIPENNVDESINYEILDLSQYLPQTNFDFDLSDEELEKIDDEIKYNFPKEATDKERRAFRESLIAKGMKDKYKAKYEIEAVPV